MARHDDDAIRISHHNVSCRYAHSSYCHRAIDRFHLNAIFTGAHKATGGKHGIAVDQSLADVAANAIDHRSGNATNACVLRHDVPPDGAVRAAIVVDNHNIAGGHIIYEIAHCARRIACRHVLHREGRPDDGLRVVGQRHDFHGLSVQPQLVQRVGYARCVQSLEKSNQLFVFFVHVLCTHTFIAWIFCRQLHRTLCHA